MLYLDNHLDLLNSFFKKIKKEFNPHEKLKEQLRLLTEPETQIIIDEIDRYRLQRRGDHGYDGNLEEQDILFLGICYQSLYDNLDEYFLFNKFCKDNSIVIKDTIFSELNKHSLEFDKWKNSYNDLQKNINNKVALTQL